MQESLRCVHTALAWRSQVGVILTRNVLHTHLIGFMCLRDWEREGYF